MEHKDIRWIQRFNNFCKALTQLTKFIDKGNLNELELQGLIQSFEYTHELAWKTLKDFLENRGNKDIYGSKDATRESFKLNLISEGEIWMDMIKSRNQTSHTYNEETTEKISAAILNEYFQAFVNLQKKLEKIAENEQG
jgi:nucleotidyltransferase substrate binding protein (TIGR01987 family)